MMEVTINKHRLTGNFTQTDNRIIEDARLSCEAYKLLTWVLHSHPKTEHSFDEWQEVIHTGIRKLKKVLAELVELGYLKQIQKRNEYGQFMRTEYQFFDSPSQQEDFTVCPKPSDGSGKDTLYNTSSNTSCMSCLSNPETEQTDLQKSKSAETFESSQSNENLSDCIKNSLNEVVAENTELKEKLSLVPNIAEFMQNLTEIIKTALLRLKHPEARGKYIKNTIIHVLEKIKAKKPTLKAKNKKNPVVDEEKAERQAFTSWLKERMDFEGHLQANDTEYCHFLISVADSLTELAFTGRAGKRVVDGYEIKERLCQIDSIDSELEEFADDFFHYFKYLLEIKASSGDIVRDTKRYMTAVLPDFVKRYSAGNILPTFHGEEVGSFRYKTPEQVERCDEYLQFVNVFGEPIQMSQQETQEMNAYLEMRYEKDSDSSVISEHPKETVSELTVEHPVTKNNTPKPDPTDENGKPMNIASEIMKMYSFDNEKIFDAFNKKFEFPSPFWLAMHYRTIFENIHESILADAEKTMDETEFQEFLQQLYEKAKFESPEFLEYMGYEGS